MPAGAEKTIRAVRKLGVEVIEIDTVELLKGGTNGSAVPPSLWCGIRVLRSEINSPMAAYFIFISLYKS